MAVSEPGLVAIYRWRVASEHEAAFVARWEQATLRLRAQGGMGSLLGRTADGELVAVALWPSAEARDCAFAARADGGEAKWPPAERLETILLETIVNHWT
jgi:hypothetical protein